MKKKKDLQWAKMQKVGSEMGSPRFPHPTYVPATKSALFRFVRLIPIDPQLGKKENRRGELLELMEDDGVIGFDP